MSEAPPKLSIIVVAYEMARELPRTIRSLSLAMQRGVAAADYELIVIDNGSPTGADPAELRAWIPDIRLLTQPAPTPSPVLAVHTALAAARGELVGVFIDGARMASPGLLAAALAASRLHRRPVIGALAFHLGPEVQSESAKRGYDQAQEDQLLAASGWEDDGYRLFGISALAGSSSSGWFMLPAETNSLFLDRRRWAELDGGYDLRFRAPGGGLANLDLWKRLVEESADPPVMLLGEATFHQFHGGVAANSAEDRWPQFEDEYRAIRGVPYERPTREPLFFGRLGEHSRKTLALGQPAA